MQRLKLEAGSVKKARYTVDNVVVSRAEMMITIPEILTSFLPQCLM